MSDYEYADEAELLEALDAALEALGRAEVPFLVVGGIASVLYGRPRWTRDVDLFFKLEDASRALEALREYGFDTEVIYEHWLAKAHWGNITVDVLTRSTPDVLLDDEMLARSVWADFKGRPVRLLPPEDLVVMKAAAASEDTPRYWYDAIGVLARSDLDWDYLLARARAGGARRVLAVLLYAGSNDVAIPIEPVRELADLVLGVSAPATPHAEPVARG